MSRPNILLIFADQHRFDCIGCNGHLVVKTPNLDRLAAEGLSFTHAFSPIPLCAPSRNCLMHGQWPVEHLAIANWDTEAPRPAREGLPCTTRALREAGYFLGHVGKWQVHPRKGPEEYGFHEHVGDGAPYAAWRAAKGLAPRPRTNAWFGEVDPGVGPEDTRLAWGAGQVIRMMEQSAPSQAPFFIQWDTTEPHLPNVLPEPYFSMYPPRDIPPWRSFSDPLEGKPYIQAQQRRTWGVDGWTWDDWAPIVSRYLGEISLLDAQMGRLLDALDRLGLRENTLVIYSTDHGDLCGSHGMIDKHYVMYDDVVHVPLIMRWPRLVAAGGQCQAFVAHSIDLATTLCEVGGAALPETFRGQSLLPLMSGAATNGRLDIMSMYHGNQFGLYSQRMIRDRRWKYVWNATAEDELYDLEADPGELRNLATSAACSGELARLRCRLVAWMEEVHDPLLNHWIRTQLLEGRKI